jgi:TATA-binding protein-associated factor Taf7
LCINKKLILTQFILFNQVTMNRHQEPPIDAPVELENQFILRLPPEPAKALRETLRSGAMNLKDRLSIRLETDMRYGEVRLDHWLLHAKLMDLPSVSESLKTIDNKSFYKTADVGQILICTEEEEPIAPEEDPPKQRKKDPNKVDKKYLWPHGIAPPLKNVRRRRFRKTLKKKYVEAPEIEKEVKRLLRVDNDAVAVKWEVLSEEALAGTSGGGAAAGGKGKTSTPKAKRKDKTHHNTLENSSQEPGIADSSLLDTSNQHSVDVAEHEIFGEAVSDSEIEDDTNSEDDDEEDGSRRIDVLTLEDEDESSRLMMSAGEDSRLSADNSSPSLTRRSGSSNLVTQFSRDMFVSSKMTDSLSSSPVDQSQSSSRYLDMKPGSSGMDRDLSRERVAAVERELAELRARRELREQQEMAGDIENVALRQRFSEMLDEMIAAKEQELEQLLDQI